MRVLLVGGGAREHIIAEQLARSAEIYAVMDEKNPGITRLSQKQLVCDYSNIEAIGGWAIRNKMDMALVTSETALAKGVVDALGDADIPSASPPSTGSVIGENTIYSFNLMESAGIPRPHFFVCRTQADIKRAMKDLGRYVVKPTVRIEMKGTKFGPSDFKKKKDVIDHGKKLMKRHGSVILEGMVDGEVFSLQAVTDGKTISTMPPVHVAKRSLEGEKGELTDGMGGFSTGKVLPFIKQADLDKARNCLRKLINTLKSKGVKYRGPIRGTFMITKRGIVMVDAYATFGSTETLNNLTLLRSQLGDVLLSIVEGSLKQLSFYEMATVAKYLVPEKYPKTTRKGEIKIDERILWNNGCKAYLHSVRTGKGKIYTSKGRSLAICAKALSVKEADAMVEAAMAAVTGKLRHRDDIASMKYINRMVKRTALLRGYPA